MKIQSAFFYSFILIPLFTVTCAWAQTSAPAEPGQQGWAHESEAAIVSTSGNTKSESYSAKQKTSFAWDKNALSSAGRYVKTSTAGQEDSKIWEASLRYERSASDIWSAYIGHGAEQNRAAGFIQRDNSDLGVKYLITKTDQLTWLVESGYRYTHTYTTSRDNTHDNFGRFYTQYEQTLTPSTVIKYWIEYLPNFSHPEAYLVNTEPSVSVMMSEIFSIKIAYLIKYQNELLAPATEYVDSTFTTSLVARF